VTGKSPLCAACNTEEAFVPAFGVDVGEDERELDVAEADVAVPVVDDCRVDAGEVERRLDIAEADMVVLVVDDCRGAEVVISLTFRRHCAAAQMYQVR